MMASSPICLLSKATKTKSWLWHRRLSHLNFGAINHLARHDLVCGLPRLKFEKDHLCSVCARGKISENEVRLNATVRNIRTNNGTEFVNQTLRDYYEQVDISHKTSVARTPQQNGVVKRRNCTLVEAARRMLIFAQAPLFLWSEAIATAYLSYLYIFGALCYLNNDSENLGKLQAKVDIAMASEQLRSGPGLQCMTLATPSSGLVPNPPP
ncbi:integrase, catalytic region, zinc finger, CCHC-type containing protein [Tanacetum coccineum]